MTQINIQRTYDPAKVLQTEAGKQIADFIDAQLQVNELSLRTLRNGVSFKDNISCSVRDIELMSGITQTLAVDRPVEMILPGRSYNKDYPLSAPLHWYYNDQNQLTVVATFTGSPTVAIKLRIVLLFS